jgi:hypothetical protein
MDTSTLIYCIVGSLIGLLIFYNIIKAAVRNGIKEARKDVEPGEGFPFLVQFKSRIFFIVK